MNRLAAFFIIQVIIIFVVGLLANWILNVPQNFAALALIAVGAAIPTTYAGDGNPLPPFCGEPLLMPLRGGMSDIAASYWDALDIDNRVALAVKFIELGNGRSDILIINRY